MPSTCLWKGCIVWHRLISTASFRLSSLMNPAVRTDVGGMGIATGIGVQFWSGRVIVFQVEEKDADNDEGSRASRARHRRKRRMVALGLAKEDELEGLRRR